MELQAREGNFFDRSPSPELQVCIAAPCEGFALLDSGYGEKLEQWGDVILQRPDSQVIWPRRHEGLWKAPDAVYRRNAQGGGAWQVSNKSLRERFAVSLGGLKFWLELTPFKHTGLFPEQALNWRWLDDVIRRLVRQEQHPVQVLNLFAYTGGATLAAAAAGAAEVVHVDAAKRVTAWAKDNLEASGLGDRRVRFIVEDAMAFVEREVRRGRLYDGIILDPPVYGRGPNGELWQIERSLGALLDEARKLLRPKAGFVLLNAYTTGLSAISLANLTREMLPAGEVVAGELVLAHANDERCLPAGIFVRQTWGISKASDV